MKRILVLTISILGCIAGKSMAQTATGDTLYAAPLQEVSIRARWTNDTERYHYNQMKFYVKTVLPYVNASTALFNEINAKSEDPTISRKERRQFIAQKQDEMKSQFEDKVKGLNVTQGVLLVKLIARQTNLNIYKMVSEVKNPLVAIKWQTWARLNGMNLDKKYHPEDEPDLENIMYELGYPLPQSYATK